MVLTIQDLHKQNTMDVMILMMSLKIKMGHCVTQMRRGYKFKITTEHSEILSYNDRLQLKKSSVY